MIVRSEVCTELYSPVLYSSTVLPCSVEGKVVSAGPAGGVQSCLASSRQQCYCPVREREREREQLCRHLSVCHQHQKYNDGCVVSLSYNNSST